MQICSHWSETAISTRTHCLWLFTVPFSVTASVPGEDSAFRIFTLTCFTARHRSCEKIMFGEVGGEGGVSRYPAPTYPLPPTYLTTHLPPTYLLPAPLPLANPPPRNGPKRKAFFLFFFRYRSIVPVFTQPVGSALESRACRHAPPFHALVSSYFPQIDFNDFEFSVQKCCSLDG